MYERRRAEIDELRIRFDRKLQERSPDTHETAEEYLGALSALIDKVEDGPVADSRIANLDTTGSINRAEEFEQWAEQERHRVRRALQDIA